MLSSLKLLLPGLLPSWRFFDSVGPSPRIEVALLQSSEAVEWRELRPRPATLSGGEMLRRLVWNPDRNESLFLTSCAERLLEAPTEHSRREIEARIDADFARGPPCLQFRVVQLRRRGAEIIREIVYVSPAREAIAA
jgi:hypothetical protein